MNKNLFPPPAAWKPGARIYAYLRDSGGTDQELSISRQVDEITAWAHHHGLVIVQWFTDEARSGRTVRKREQLQSMLEAFRRGEQVGGVVVWSYDRFARNAVQSQLYRSEIRDRGYIFHSLTDYIPDGSEAVVFEAFRDYVSEQYSVKLSINVKSGSRAVLEKYKVIGGFPPRGFMRERVEIGAHRDGSPRIGYKWVPDPDLVPAVQLAFEMRARGATLYQIMQATRLHPSINSYTTFFRNRLYMGVLEYADLVIDDYCEPIVSAELWERANALGKKRARISDDHNPRRHASQFLFSGLLYCQNCGAPMNGHVVIKRGSPRREYYACSRKHRRKDCDAREIPAKHLERDILNQLETIALDLERLLQFQARVRYHYERMYDQRDGERLRLRRELRDQTKRIKHLINAIGERGHSRALLDALHTAELEEITIKQKLEDLDNDIPPREHTPAQLAAYAEEIKTALRGDDLHKKKNAVRMLANRIIAKRSDSEIHGVLYFLPIVCLGGGTPAEVLTEGIHFAIEIPKYTLRAR